MPSSRLARPPSPSSTRPTLTASGPAGHPDRRAPLESGGSARSAVLGRSVWLVAALVTTLFTAPSAQAADPATLTPFSSAAAGTAPAPWQFETLPKKKDTAFSIVSLDGKNVLKAEADASYGNLVHDLHLPVEGHAWLAWRWRVEQLVENADLTSRSGDDSPARVCVFFDYDAGKLPFGERASLRIARSVAGVDVPTETLCYVWDNKLDVGTRMNSAFTKRVRLIVLQSGSGKLGQWVSERRDVAADYLKAFADEAGGVVPVITGVGLSADSDNTQGHGVAYFGDVTIEK
ncbi:MAG: hypothetical protein JWQ11_2829 [Rhizobacter sp.]|nr:hypothetical protein [Rhizobacter sp.]